jgi:hypothetical protein
MHQLYEIKCQYCDQVFQVKKGRIKAKFCSKVCQINWQKSISWEERIGKEKADQIRKERSEQKSGKNNPTANPEIAKKVSESLKKYLKENPRIGDKNPFYGKQHSEENKKYLSESKKGKRAYNDEQYQKCVDNHPRGVEHPLWNGGSSFLPYPPTFNRKLKTNIKNKYKNKCLLCDKENKRLAIHHIDYNKQNCETENLVPLCYSCHSKTNWNRENWIILINKIKHNFV